MQLKLQRSQRTGGVLGNTVIFCLDVRADYSPEEQDNIRKYRLGQQIIYSSQAARKHVERAHAQLDRVENDSFKEKFAGLTRGALSAAMARMSLNISIASLGRGHHIECKDLDEMLDAEDTVRTACKNVTKYLEAAATFDGSEMVIEYVKGEERVHVTQHAPPLLTYQPDAESASNTPADSAPPPTSAEAAFEDMGRNAARLWAKLKERWLVIEKQLVAFAAAKGWAVNDTQIRAACAIAAFLIVILFLQVV